MPELAIDEDRQAGNLDDDVRMTWKGPDMTAKRDAGPPEQPECSSLNDAVLGPYPGHERATVFFGKEVGHATHSDL